MGLRAPVCSTSAAGEPNNQPGNLSLNSPACITLHYSASPDSVSSVCSANREGNFMSNIPKTVDGVVLDSRWATPYLARLGFLSHFIP